jgi:hypothetical protein
MPHDPLCPLRLAAVRSGGDGFLRVFDACAERTGCFGKDWVMTLIEIDLRDLTARRLRTALENMGSPCEYASPCIIGTLIPRRQRRVLDNGLDVDDTEIGTLIEQGYINIPEEQIQAAKAIQWAFDRGEKEKVRELAKPWIAASKEPTP